MARLARWIATVGGVGYCPVAPGTAGSLVGVALGWLSLRRQMEYPLEPLAWVIITGLLGVWASGRLARELGQRDPSCAVIDETVCMWFVFACMPSLFLTWWMAAVAFLVFRVFDILKPLPLKLLERMPGGWGIMLDDVGAAAYTLLLIYGVLRGVMALMTRG